jgi:hypothetical protein
MGLMGPMRLMGMRKEATRAGMSTERLKSGAAKSLEKTAPRRAEIFAPPAEDQPAAGIGWGEVPCRNSATNGVAGKA